MRKQDTIDTFIARAAEACRLVGADNITVMMQAADTDPLTFTSVLRLDNLNPFNNENPDLIRLAKASAFIRNRDAAHREAERAIHMEDLNRNPEFVNGYLRVYADGHATLHVHCGIGPMTRVLKQEYGEAPQMQASC